MVFRITARTVLIQLVDIAMMSLFTVLGVVYLVAFKSAGVGNAFFFMGITAFIFSADSIVLFIQYFLKNRSSVVEFLSSDQIRWSQSGRVTYISPGDIERIDLNLTYPIFDGRIGWGGEGITLFMLNFV